MRQWPPSQMASSERSWERHPANVLAGIIASAWVNSLGALQGFP
jgi:hypothetical protein